MSVFASYRLSLFFGVNQKLSRPKLDTIDILIIKQNWNQFLLGRIAPNPLKSSLS